LADELGHEIIGISGEPGVYAVLRVRDLSWLAAFVSDMEPVERR
jgi:hypothetical protein